VRQPLAIGAWRELRGERVGLRTYGTVTHTHTHTCGEVEGFTPKEHNLELAL
jgi:hypothetical protein